MQSLIPMAVGLVLAVGVAWVSTRIAELLIGRRSEAMSKDRTMACLVWGVALAVFLVVQFWPAIHDAFRVSFR